MPQLPLPYRWYRPSTAINLTLPCRRISVLPTPALWRFPMRFLSPALFRPLYLFLALLLVVPLASQLTPAQSSPPIRKAPPPPPPPPATDQQRFASYWTTATGWPTAFHLRNNP